MYIVLGNTIMSDQDKQQYYQHMSNQQGPNRAAFTMISTLQQLGSQATPQEQLFLQGLENQANINGYGYNHTSQNNNGGRR